MNEWKSILIGALAIAAAILLNGYLDRNRAVDALAHEAVGICLETFLETNPNWDKADAWLRCYRQIEGHPET